MSGYRSALLAMLVLVGSTIAHAGTREETFPRPANLEPNITFWKRVFTEWGERQYVIHDKDNLEIVYEVIKLDPPAGTVRQMRAVLEAVGLRVAHYATLLQKLEAGGPDGLGEEARRLYALWGCPCEAGELAVAAEGIRVQRGIRERFTAGLRRSEQMRPKILPILRRHSVPDELAALPLIESSFNDRAVSHAKAVGIWQFIRATAQRFGLTVRGKRDDRRDAIRSTGAAARMLQHHYKELGAWPLAITAYNHGLSGVWKAVDSLGTRDIGRIVAEYQGPRFGFASRNFYAEFLAAVDLMDLHFTRLEASR